MAFKCLLSNPAHAFYPQSFGCIAAGLLRLLFIFCWKYTIYQENSFQITYLSIHNISYFPWRAETSSTPSAFIPLTKIDRRMSIQKSTRLYLELENRYRETTVPEPIGPIDYSIGTNRSDFIGYEREVYRFYWCRLY